jgi:hypothetical protein
MAHDFRHANWHKSSRSNGNGGANCVEVAVAGTDIGVRDSKNSAGPVLTFTASDWTSFVDGTKLGRFDSAH